MCVADNCCSKLCVAASALKCTLRPPSVVCSSKLRVLQQVACVAACYMSQQVECCSKANSSYSNVCVAARTLMHAVNPVAARTGPICSRFLVGNNQ